MAELPKEIPFGRSAFFINMLYAKRRCVMYRVSVIVVITLCFLLAGCTTKQKLTSLEDMPAGAPVTTVQVKGEKCTWSPDFIRVIKGTHVLLEVKSVDWDYNFQLKGYDLRFVIPEGNTVTAEFYASKAGEFEFGCYIKKGLNYYWGGMVGKLIVE